ILRNDGGRFTDVTEQVAPQLAHPGGMITDAVWIDFDGDGRLDLVTVGEWMPIQFFKNDRKQLQNVTQSMHLPPLRGWWYSLATGDLDNDGGGTFSASALPNLAQIAPIKAIIAHDVDGDGHLDLLVAGNLYDTEPNTPRADAGDGLWLRGDGKGNFTPVPPTKSGFLAPLNVSGLALTKTNAGMAVLVANTGDSLQV